MHTNADEQYTKLNLHYLGSAGEVKSFVAAQMGKLYNIS